MKKELNLQVVERYFFNEVNKIVSIVSKVENLPYFYQIFSMIFEKVVKADNWKFSIEQS